jgi:folate-binding protein YgfZ
MIFQEMRFAEFRPGAVIRVTGEDAFTFLQGQFTNELRQAVGRSTYGLWLDQKGRVLADSDVLRISEHEFLVVSTNSAADLIKRRLEDYIVADDVAVADETVGIHGIVLLGAGAVEGVAKIVGAPVAPGGFVRGADATAFSGRRTSDENFEILGTEETLRTVREKLLAAGVKRVEPSALEFARITSGIPKVPDDVGPGDLPNEAGLDAVAISYTKGCYLGQEVMARLKNLGQVRRRLHVVRGHGTAPGSRTALFQGERKVGEIRSAASWGGDFAALAMLSLIHFKAGAGLSLEAGGAATLAVNPHG